jgi:hypothetical protein
MNCDEVELALPEGGENEAVRSHLAQCAGCRETAAVLGLAMQTGLSAVEKAKLSSLSVSAQTEWARLARRRDAARKFVGLAVAASLGAVIASGLMWKLKPIQPLPQSEPQVLMLMDDSAPLLADEELTFEEVSWPSLNEEGDVL